MRLREKLQKPRKRSAEKNLKQMLVGLGILAVLAVLFQIVTGMMAYQDAQRIATIRRVAHLHDLPGGGYHLEFHTKPDNLFEIFQAIHRVTPELRGLNLTATEIDRLESLAAFPSLEKVDLRRTPIRDLSPLQSLPELQEIDLRDTSITALSPLQALPKLETVYIDQRMAEILRADIQRLREHLPALQIHCDGLIDCTFPESQGAP